MAFDFHLPLITGDDLDAFYGALGRSEVSPLTYPSLLVERHREALVLSVERVLLHPGVHSVRVDIETDPNCAPLVRVHVMRDGSVDGTASTRDPEGLDVTLKARLNHGYGPAFDRLREDMSKEVLTMTTWQALARRSLGVVWWSAKERQQLDEKLASSPSIRFAVRL